MSHFTQRKHIFKEHWSTQTKMKTKKIKQKSKAIHTKWKHTSLLKMVAILTAKRCVDMYENGFTEVYNKLHLCKNVQVLTNVYICKTITTVQRYTVSRIQEYYFYYTSNNVVYTKSSYFAYIVQTEYHKVLNVKII